MMTPAYVEPELRIRGNTIRTMGSLGHELFHMLASEIATLTRTGENVVRLDFAGLTGAFPEGAVPLIALVACKRSQGARFEIGLPSSASLRNLFLNTNWAHFVDPENYGFFRAPFSHHLSVQNFVDLREQDRVVSMLLDVIFRSVRLPKSHQDALEWSIAELTENVLTHSQSPVGGFVQATAWKHSIQFTVADAGIGVFESLRSAFPTLDDIEAVRFACQAGVTGRPNTNNGNGLAGSRFLAEDSGGYFALTSGLGNYRAGILGASRARTDVLEQLPPDEGGPGTTVTVRLGDSSDFSAMRSIGRLAGGNHEFHSHLDSLFEADQSGAFHIAVSSVVTNTRTRTSGKELRHLIENALERAGSSTVLVDWIGAGSPTSSFADEAIAKVLERYPEELVRRGLRMTGLTEMGTSVVQAALASKLSRRFPRVPEG